MYYELKNLKRIFDKISYSTSAATAFTQILDHALLPFQYFPTGDELRAAHKKLTGYKHLLHLQEFLTELANLNPEGFGDPIGEFYMQEISQGRLGQYFTPEHMAVMIALMITGDPNELDGKSVYDPACGSGRFFLSAARMNRNMYFFGADLDLTCCKMTLLNMLLNSLSGEVAHMNTLSNEFYVGYKVQTKLIDGYHYPYFTEFSNPEESRIWIQPVKETKSPAFIQGNLFDDIF